MGNRCIVGFVGRSGSGKTTLVLDLIRAWTAAGTTVSAIKHTHHTLNEDRRGDTQRFLDAGAVEAILCGDREAVRFTAKSSERNAYGTADDLVARASGERVVIEGFKDRGTWPRVLVAIDERSIGGVDLAPFAAVVLRERLGGWADGRPPLFFAAELAGSQRFLDTICGP
jgi:molybdopterin-guanine dinucleotide biosynthesis protein MobB